MRPDTNGPWRKAGREVTKGRRVQVQRRRTRPRELPQDDRRSPSGRKEYPW